MKLKLKLKIKLKRILSVFWGYLGLNTKFDIKSSLLDRNRSDEFARTKLETISSNRKKLPTITAVYRVKNADTFFEISALSIAPLVNEIVIIDNGSSDETLNIANKIKTKLEGICSVEIYEYNKKLALAGDGYKNAIETEPETSLSKFYDFCFSKASSDYLMKVDAHYIFFPKSLELIQDKLRTQPKVIRYRGIESFGKYIGYENFIFKNDGYYFVDGQHYEHLILRNPPSMAERLRSTLFKPAFFHVKRLSYIKFISGTENLLRSLYK